MLIRIIPKERTLSNVYNIDWLETAISQNEIISNIKFTEDYILFFEIMNNNIVVSQSLGQGSKGGAMVRALASHQCGRGSNPGVGAICGLSLLLVLSLTPRGFSPGTPVFPSPQKPTFPNSNSTRNQVDEEPLCGCATCKSLFIYLFYLFTRRVSKIRGYFAGKK